MIRNDKRISANYVRKFLPSLRRESTPEGRKWTVNGETYFDCLQDVIGFYNKPVHELPTVNPVAVEEVEKEVSDVSAS